MAAVRTGAAIERWVSAGRAAVAMGGVVLGVPFCAAAAGPVPSGGVAGGPSWSVANPVASGAGRVPARVRTGRGVGGFGPGATCSDGSGIGVDAELGALPLGPTVLIGDTAGNGRGICAYTFFGSPVGSRPVAGDEDIYSFTVSEPSRARVAVNAAGGNNDFYLLNGTFLFDNEDILGDGTLFGAVADDAIGFVDADGPMLNTVGEHEVLAPGTTYYFVVDTHPAGADGAYDIALVIESAAPFACPDGSTAEGEPVCGEGYVDVFNGGCDADVQAFTPINDGDVICGSAGVFDDGTSVDTDWYSFTIGSLSAVRFDFVAGFSGEFGLAAQIVPGVAGCENTSGGFDTAVPFSSGEEVFFEELLGAGTYYIVVEPWLETPCGSEYAISVDAHSVGVECVAYATDEGEGDCFDGYIDDFNGGCNSVPEVFRPLHINESVCGTVGTYDGGTLRDTDWYEIVLDRSQTLTLRAAAESDYLLGMIDQIIPGVPGCDNVNPGVAPFALGEAGEESTVVVTLDAGTHYVFFAPQEGTTAPCGSVYALTVESDSVCSDGSGLVVDADLGVLVQSDTVVAGDTRVEARGLCAYSDSGVLLGGPQPGGEHIAAFEVGLPSVASVGIAGGSAGQDFFLLAGDAVSPDGDILGDGSLFGAEAVDAVGFVDGSGPMLNAAGEQDVLLPGRAYWLVVDTSGADGAFDIDFIIDSGCGPVDFAMPLGLLDLADIVAWINLFQAGDTAVDLAAPFGLFDLADIVAWIAEFTIGCR